MCQISVVVEREDGEELLVEDVTKMELASGRLTISTLFDGSREVENMNLRAIDFMAGKVYLQAGNSERT